MVRHDDRRAKEAVLIAAALVPYLEHALDMGCFAAG
jgi:hypothetical protein